MSEEDRLKTNNEKVTINDYYYYYLLKCENILNELEKWVEYQATHTMQQHNYYGVLDKIKELKGSDKEW